MTQKSVTNDEPPHIAAGYSYLKTGDFRINPEHPPLLKMVSGFPLLFLNAKIDTKDSAWVNAKKWEFGHNFLFKYNKNADQLVFWARFPVILLSMLLGFYVFRWAKELYGVNAGLFGLFLYSFSPNILAHSRLVTTDLGMCTFVTMSLYYFWRFLKKPSLMLLVISGILFGIAQITKFTAIYLVPIYLIIGIITIAYKRKIFFSDKKLKEIAIFFLQIFIIFIIGILVIMPFYGFRGLFEQEDKQLLAEKLFSNNFLSTATYNSIRYIPIPTRYVYGLAFVIFHSKDGHTAYLMGDHSYTGWYHYFLIAFLIKTPIPTLILLFLTIIFFKKIKHKKTLDEWFLIIPILVFFSAFVFNRINIGLRHILQIYPFLFIFISKTINLRFKKQKMFNFLLVILAVWCAVSSLLIFPNYLAYFNEFIGGPTKGHYYLTDSNLDWGQDLKSLKPYLDKKGIKEINLGYFGKDSQEYRGIEYKQLQCFPMQGITAISYSLYEGLNEEQARCASWLRSYEPIDAIRYSMLIFNITIKDEDIKQKKEEYCLSECKIRCESVELEYKSSLFNETTSSCDCECKR